jgi:radical SAM-linked protein
MKEKTVESLSPTTAVAASNEPMVPSNEPMVRWRVRLRFSKQGDLRWIGHRDLARCFERWFRRAGLPLGMSEGFHPKPRMSFPSALAVGIAGLEEVLELELSEPLSGEELSARLAPHALPGLVVSAIAVVPPGSKKAQLCRVEYQIEVPPQCQAGLAERIAQIRAAGSWPVQRPNRPQPVDLCAVLQELSFDQHTLRMRLRAGQEGGAGPRDVLAALGLADLEQQGACLVRTLVELQP